MNHKERSEAQGAAPERTWYVKLWPARLTRLARSQVSASNMGPGDAHAEARPS